MTGALERSRTEQLLRTLVIIAGLVCVALPLIVLLLGSFKPPGDFFSARLLPTHWTTHYYRQLLAGGSASLLALGNSVAVAAMTTVIATLLGTLAAFGLARLRNPWVPALVFLLLAVRFYPKITTILPYYVLMRNAGLLDSLVAIVIAHVSITVPIVILIMIGFFRELPQSVEEAAVLDGGTPLQVFRHVALPMTLPGVATSAILVAMVSWNEFLLASSVASDRAKTLPILISSFITDKGTDLGQMSAVTLLIIVPIVLFILLVQRLLVRGLTLGAVKQ
jgi:multiple sugar transport system permease protein